MISGELHEVSERIGRLTQAVENIESRAKEDRKDQADRHEENQAAIEDLRRTIQSQIGIRNAESAAGPLTLTSRQRIALMGAGLGLITAAVWLIEKLFGAMLGWLISHFRP